MSTWPCDDVQCRRSIPSIHDHVYLRLIPLQQATRSNGKELLELSWEMWWNEFSTKVKIFKDFGPKMKENLLLRLKRVRDQIIASGEKVFSSRLLTKMKSSREAAWPTLTDGERKKHDGAE